MSETMFPERPSIRVHDPLGDMMGAGDGLYTYTFDDVVKLSGHACPTVAGGFLLAKHALEALFGGEMPQRGDVRVTVNGRPDEGVNGPLTQVISLVTGAAAENGFHGLAGQYVRKDLLRFEPGRPGEGVRFRFERISTGKTVTLAYDASMIPGAPTMSQDLGAILSGTADQTNRARFRDAWRDRVVRILEDGGRSTVQRIE